MNSTRDQCDLVISLGTNCALTYNLRAYYGTHVTGLLDWTITPLGRLPDIIRSRFKIVGNGFSNELRKVDANGTDDIVHMPTGILLHHEFPRGGQGTILNDWQSHISTVASKLTYLGNRMNARLISSKRPALFINGTGYYDGLDESIAIATHSPKMLQEIIDAFRVTYPHAEPIFCVLNGHPASVESVRDAPNVRVTSVANYGDWHEGVVNHYAGCKRGWAEALSSIHITYESANAV